MVKICHRWSITYEMRIWNEMKENWLIYVPIRSNMVAWFDKKTGYTNGDKAIPKGLD